MELFTGHHLKLSIARPALYPLPRTLLHRIIEQAAGGLAYMHDKGWVHRDVKPENILFNKSGEVRVIDYALAKKIAGGLAKMFGGKMAREGTRTYISPEQIRCEPPSPSADIYSFGITCYELACGRPPFRANSSQELLEKHLGEKPIPLTTHNKRVTPEFNDLILKMIQKRAADRFSSLDEFLSRFRSIRIYTGRSRSAGGPGPGLLVRAAPARSGPAGRAARGRPGVARLDAPGGPPKRDVPAISCSTVSAKDLAPMPSASEPRLAFEAPIHEMESRLSEMEAQYARNRSTGDTTKIAEQIRRLRRELAELKREIYSQLDPWQIVQVSRHQDRPQTRDYIDLLFEQFLELHGDRAVGDDKAIVTGLAHLDEHKIMFIGHQKGKNLAERTACHFGCAHPEGYRKALVKMRLAAEVSACRSSRSSTPPGRIRGSPPRSAGRRR